VRADAFLLVLSALAVLSGCADSDSPKQVSIYPIPADEVCINEICFMVEVADTPALRQKGLMFREKLDSNRGMLFVFDEPGEHRFWMKNTLIPLDIIWIDAEGEVVFIHHNTPLCKADPCQSYGPPVKAKYVLELGSGVATRSGISQGSRLRIRYADQVAG